MQENHRENVPRTSIDETQIDANDYILHHLENDGHRIRCPAHVDDMGEAEKKTGQIGCLQPTERNRPEAADQCFLDDTPEDRLLQEPHQEDKGEENQYLCPWQGVILDHQDTLILKKKRIQQKDETTRLQRIHEIILLPRNLLQHTEARQYEHGENQRRLFTKKQSAIARDLDSLCNMCREI